MPHVALVSFVGFRVRQQEVAALGMALPGLEKRAAAIAELPSLGLLILAGMTPARWTCSYHGVGSCDDEFLDKILAEHPSLVAVSAFTASIEEAYRFAVAVRQRGVPVVIGGLHASTCADEAQRFCDAVVVGEGEASWGQVLADAEAGALQPQYRPSPENGGVPWPLPRYDLLGPGKPPRMTLQTQRGCPLACDFCAGSRLLAPFREKPVENIERELAAIRSMHPRPLVELADDNTFAGDRDVAQLLDVFDRAGIRYFTEVDWRIGERPEVLGRLARSGCVQVLVGIESLVFRYPGMGQKQADLGRIMDAVDAIQETGVAVNGCFIMGADGETRASMDRLPEFILASSLAEVQVTMQTPFPGTRLYNRLKREGRLLQHRGWPYYTMLDVTFQPDCITPGELEAGFREVLAAVFSGEASRRRNAIRRQVWKRNPSLRS